MLCSTVMFMDWACQALSMPCLAFAHGHNKTLQKAENAKSKPFLASNVPECTQLKKWPCAKMAMFMLLNQKLAMCQKCNSNYCKSLQISMRSETEKCGRNQDVRPSLMVDKLQPPIKDNRHCLHLLHCKKFPQHNPHLCFLQGLHSGQCLVPLAEALTHCTCLHLELVERDCAAPISPAFVQPPFSARI